jgi:tRNA (cytidine/uridine-2'-O-)-methyltransferase
MFHIVLYQPEIPPNTGNIIRLAANNGCQLHLIKPLGFSLDEKKMRRAGLDYHEFTDLVLYESYECFLQQAKPVRLFALTTKAKKNYDQVRYQSGDFFIFGPETRGLPREILEQLSVSCLTIPMQANSRSLNLSNSVAIVTYEAWRQLAFS